MHMKWLAAWGTLVKLMAAVALAPPAPLPLFWWQAQN
jgi:hypothetical protein